MNKYSNDVKPFVNKKRIVKWFSVCRFYFLLIKARVMTRLRDWMEYFGLAKAISIVWMVFMYLLNFMISIIIVYHKAISCAINKSDNLKYGGIIIYNEFESSCFNSTEMWNILFHFQTDYQSIRILKLLNLENSMLKCSCVSSNSIAIKIPCIDCLQQQNSYSEKRRCLDERKSSKVLRKTPSLFTNRIQYDFGTQNNKIKNLNSAALVRQLKWLIGQALCTWNLARMLYHSTKDFCWHCNSSQTLCMTFRISCMEVYRNCHMFSRCIRWGIAMPYLDRMSMDRCIDMDHPSWHPPVERTHRTDF